MQQEGAAVSLTLPGAQGQVCSRTCAYWLPWAIHALPELWTSSLESEQCWVCQWKYFPTRWCWAMLCLRLTFPILQYHLDCPWKLRTASQGHLRFRWGLCSPCHMPESFLTAISHWDTLLLLPASTAPAFKLACAVPVDNILLPSGHLKPCLGCSGVKDNHFFKIKIRKLLWNHPCLQRDQVKKYTKKIQAKQQNFKMLTKHKTCLKFMNYLHPLKLGFFIYV